MIHVEHLGVENGRWGVESFTELKVQHRPR